MYLLFAYTFFIFTPVIINCTCWVWLENRYVHVHHDIYCRLYDIFRHIWLGTNWTKNWYTAHWKNEEICYYCVLQTNRYKFPHMARAFTPNVKFLFIFFAHLAFLHPTFNISNAVAILHDVGYDCSDMAIKDQLVQSHNAFQFLFI